MLTATNLTGFGGAVPKITYVEGSQIAQATGSNIGDMTGNGGLAAAFDGVDSQTAANCAARLGSPANSYVGKDYSGGPFRIFKAEMIGASSQGFARDASPTITLTLRAKNGSAPSSFSDGTSLGSTSFTDTSASSQPMRTINNGGDLSQLWDYVWGTIEASSGTEFLCAEFKRYEAVPS